MTEVEPWPWPFRVRPHPSEDSSWAMALDGTPIRVAALRMLDGDDRVEHVLSRGVEGVRWWAAMVLGDLVESDTGTRSWAGWVSSVDDDLLRRWLGRGIQVRTQRAPGVEDMAVLGGDDVERIVAVLDRWSSVAVVRAAELYDDCPPLREALHDERVADLGSIVIHLTR